MGKWSYGKAMLEEEAIKSLDEWSDQKEYVYSTMDERFDYLWYENKDGIHFIDRQYSDGNLDSMGREREENGTLELHFKNLDEVEQWIKEKQ